MKICKICIQPDSRPGLYFTDDDICGACLWEKEKAGIDWDKRYDELIEIAKSVKSNNLKNNYDCVSESVVVRIVQDKLWLPEMNLDLDAC